MKPVLSLFAVALFATSLMTTLPARSDVEAASPDCRMHTALAPYLFEHGLATGLPLAACESCQPGSRS